MAALPNGTSQEDFYNDDTLHGNYQYVTIKDIVNNFMLTVVGDRNHIQFIERDVVIFHAKRGLQELNYDSLKEIKAVEIDLNDTLALILPEDYVKYVRVSWVDENGKFHTMVKNEETMIAKAYLQDNAYNILFDENGEVLEAQQNIYTDTFQQGTFSEEGSNCSGNGNMGGRYGLNPSLSNSNGWFNLDKRKGLMRFSSNVGSRTIVLEYISDGVEYNDISEIKIHKFAEKALMLYIESEILSVMDKIPEYVVKRKVKAAHVAKLKSKNRLSGLTYEELLQVMRGKQKRLK
ncbi:virion structural protein [Maribacter phage Panino]